MNENDLIGFLADKWRKSGVEQGDVLLVHSSLKRLLKKVADENDVSATPEIIYKSLLLAIGDQGTLILPLFNFDFPKSKFFDVRNTPSHMGALTEIARNNSVSVRTGHPIYSFSIIGKYADQFKGIDNESGYGPDSPFAVLRKLKARIASIGLSDQNSMTSYHYVEECNEVPYRYFKDFTGQYIDQNGHQAERTYKLFVRNTEQGVNTDVNRCMDLLWEKGLYSGEKYNEGYGMRTILFEDFFNEVDQIIKSGKAEDYLFSIKR